MPKRCEIGPRLLLMANKKSHKSFHVKGTSFTLDDLEGALHTGTGTAIGCSASSLATAGLLVDINIGYGIVTCSRKYRPYRYITIFYAKR